MTWASIPALPIGVSYVEAVAGNSVTALRRSDGNIVVSGFVLTTGSQHLAAVPQLSSGESFLQASATFRNIAARVGPTCTYTSFAQGCAGSRPATRLIPRDTPRIGMTHSVRLFDLPNDIAILAMGLQRIPPTSLGALGVPGCTWHVSLDATAILVGQGNQAVWQLPIPNLTSLVGLQFHNQAAVLDPAAGNSLGLVISDAATGVVGYP